MRKGFYVFTYLFLDQMEKEGTELRITQKHE